ncbi:hypothetical protein PLESTM_001570000 [Pleodorina starrii]|nr:hypothetical protein PLESTM_001570000 [Pleodorina starrii]
MVWHISVVGSDNYAFTVELVLTTFADRLAFSSTVITALTLLYLTLPRKVEPLRKSRLRSLCSVCCTNFLVNAFAHRPETTSCGDYPGATCGRLATLMGWLETTAIAVLLLISALTLVAIGLGVSGASARGCYCCPYSSTCCSRGSVAGRDSGSGGGEGEQRW